MSSAAIPDDTVNAWAADEILAKWCSNGYIGVRFGGPALKVKRWLTEVGARRVSAARVVVRAADALERRCLVDGHRARAILVFMIWVLHRRAQRREAVRLAAAIRGLGLGRREVVCAALLDSRYVGQHHALSSSSKRASRRKTERKGRKKRVGESSFGCYGHEPILRWRARRSSTPPSAVVHHFIRK